MNNCEHCKKSSETACGVYNFQCPGCIARFLISLPKKKREYNAERLLEGRTSEFKQQARAEYARLQQLRKEAIAAQAGA